MADFLRPTAAFEVRDGGPFALKAWNFDTAREELVSVDGRVLVFENLQRIRDFFGHLTGRGPIGDRIWGYHAVRNMSPVRYAPKSVDMWSREWYAKHAGDPTPTARRRAGIGGVVPLTART